MQGTVQCVCPLETAVTTVPPLASSVGRGACWHGRMPSKLVRDRIPDIIRAKGEEAVARVADAEEYRRRLAEKLVEEAAEFAKDQTVEELADTLEVLEAICADRGIAMGEVRAAQRKKRAERGGFAGRVILETAGE
jgi:predicted house-cleaning noncanonical NTP pyrophosphatase (MazG superfamily)